MLMLHLHKSLSIFPLSHFGDCTISVVPSSTDMHKLTDNCTLYRVEQFNNYSLVAFLPSGSLLKSEKVYLTFDTALNDILAFKKQILNSIKE